MKRDHCWCGLGGISLLLQPQGYWHAGASYISFVVLNDLFVRVTPIMVHFCWCNLGHLPVGFPLSSVKRSSCSLFKLCIDLTEQQTIVCKQLGFCVHTKGRSLAKSWNNREHMIVPWGTQKSPLLHLIWQQQPGHAIFCHEKNSMQERVWSRIP